MSLTSKRFPDPVTKDEAALRRGEEHVAADARGLNFFQIDRSFQDLLKIYLTADEYNHFWEHCPCPSQPRPVWARPSMD